VSDNGGREIRKSVADDAAEWVERAFAQDVASGHDAAMLAWGKQSPEHARALREALFLRGRMINAWEGLAADPSAAALLAEARVMPEQHSGFRMGRRAFLTGAVAATAAGVVVVNPPLGLWPSLGELRADYRTGVGERKTVQVAQNLTVELNTRTAVSRRQDDRAWRLELISGEVAVDAGHLMRPKPRPAMASSARALRTMACA
jgi:transmembrane sensor